MSAAEAIRKREAARHPKPAAKQKPSKAVLKARLEEQNERLEAIARQADEIAHVEFGEELPE